MAHGNTKHGMFGTPIYVVWGRMIQRCSNPNDPSYPRYGGAGITVDPSWRKFENFYADMGDRPDGMTLERKNNALGYTASNCIWATRAEQARNRKNVRWYEYNGERMTLADLGKALGIPRSTAHRWLVLQGKTLDGVTRVF